MSRMIANAKNYDMIQRLAKGESAVAIAEDYNLSPDTVRNFKFRNKKIIEQQAERYLSSLPDIVDIVKQDIKTAKKLTEYIYDPITYTNDTAIQKHEDILNFKAQVQKISHEILKSIGIHASQAPSIVFQSYYQDNSQKTVNIVPGIMNALTKSVSSDNYNPLSGNDIQL